VVLPTPLAQRWFVSRTRAHRGRVQYALSPPPPSPPPSQPYALAVNNGANHLHGGLVGWDKRVWEHRTEVTADDAQAIFTLVSHDGEEGYPGRVEVRATYKLTADSALAMTFVATTDAEGGTPINVCNHAYWNLSGTLEGTGKGEDVRGHELTLACPHVLPVDDTQVRAQLAAGEGGLRVEHRPAHCAQIPTGERLPVAGTAFDFTKPALVGARLAEVDGGGGRAG
jgi:aldose 1-epimerase